MHFDIDIIIVVSFLIINLLIGISSGKGITTLKDYAIGNRNFSTAAITATIIATWVAGSSFSRTVANTYNDGLYYFIPKLGDVMSFFIIAYFLAPRMQEFLGKLSIAEAMGTLFGNYVRMITAVIGIVLAIGNVAVQFTILTALLNHGFGISGAWATIISGFTVISYASFGGIKSVTFTDMIQFLTFGIVMPMIAFVVWKSCNNAENLLNILTQDPLFNCHDILNYHNPNFFKTLFLFLYFMIPALDSAVFQRISMSKNTLQISKAFIIAGIFILLFRDILYFFIGILLRVSSIELNINSSNIASYVLDNYLCRGFKGLFIIGIMAMIMSTADSYINSSSVLFANDVFKSLQIKLTEQKSLLLARIASLLIGIAALLLSLFSRHLLDLIVTVYSFYMPIVSVPLLLAIFGFRSTSKAVLLGMIAGFVTVVIFKMFSNIDSVIPGMVANLIILNVSHYVLKQPGGWVGIKDSTPLDAIRLERKRKIENFVYKIKSFSLINFCKNNSPKEENFYVYFGLFCFIATVAHAYSLRNNQNGDLLTIIYQSLFIIATIFITYPAWHLQFKKEASMAIVWNLGIFYLIFISSLLVIISNFSQTQFTILMSNLMIIATLLSWQAVMFMIIIGVTLSVQFCKFYIGVDFLLHSVDCLQSKIIFSLLFISSILTAFFKPKQQREEISENFKNYLEEQNVKTQLDLLKLSRHREEFVNRIDKQCISVFKSIYKQIIKLEKELQNPNNNDQQNKKIDLIQIVKRLKIGAEYLDDVIWTVKNQLKIKPVKVILKQFFYNCVDDYKKVSSNDDTSININFKTNHQEIEIDQACIKKIIITCINHGLTNSKTYNFNISIEDTIIEYDLNLSDLLKIKRDAIRISIIFKNTNLQQKSIAQLLKPTFTSIDEINFADIYRIISAHYGEMDIILNDSKNLIYSIIIPVKLREIRPKSMDLPDTEFESIKEINAFVINKNKELVRDIAKQLIKSSMNPNFIAKITKLTLHEVKELELEI